MTGAESGIVVLDVDGEIGRRTLNSLAGFDPSILETRIHRTGSGGSHLFFQHPGGLCSNAVKPLPGIDTRADGGLIVLPPSLHPSGGRYESQNAAPIAALPDSLKPLFVQCHKEGQGATRSASQFARLGIDRDHNWVYRRLQSMTQETILLCVDRGQSGVAGERKATQFRWTWTIQDPPTNDIDALLEGL